MLELDQIENVARDAGLIKGTRRRGRKPICDDWEKPTFAVIKHDFALPGLQKVLAPEVIEIAVNTFPTT